MVLRIIIIITLLWHLLSIARLESTHFSHRSKLGKRNTPSDWVQVDGLRTSKILFSFRPQNKQVSVFGLLVPWRLDSCF
ncbi:hypothetical protein IWZ01DRAFT_28806 [Phyllosticta capitalensis]